MMEGSVKNFPPRLSMFFRTVLVHTQVQLTTNNLLCLETQTVLEEPQIESKKTWQSGGIFLNGY
jgi:hypothetical protein